MLLPPFLPSTAFSTVDRVIRLATKLLRHPLGLKRLLEPEAQVFLVATADEHMAQCTVHFMRAAMGWVVVLLAAILPGDDGVVRPKLVKVGVRVNAFVAGRDRMSPAINRGRNMFLICSAGVNPLQSHRFAHILLQGILTGALDGRHRLSQQV